MEVEIRIINDQCHAVEIPNPPMGTTLIRKPKITVYLDCLNDQKTYAKLINPPNKFFEELETFLMDKEITYEDIMSFSPCPKITIERYDLNQDDFEELIKLFKKFS